MTKALLMSIFILLILPSTIFASNASWKMAVLIYKNAEFDFPGDIIPISNLQGKYFNNIDLSGEPALTRTDEKIDFDWGNNKPAPEINQENFSIRWTGNFNLSAAKDLYFNAESDDGVKVYLDENLIIDDWKVQVAHFYVIKNVPSGLHSFKVEYFQGGGGAIIRFFIGEAKHSSFQMTNEQIQLIRDVFSKIPPKIISWSDSAVSLNYDVKEIDRPITTQGNPVKKGWWWASPSSTKPELDTLSNYDSVYALWPNDGNGDFCNYIEKCGWGFGLKPSEWTRGMTYAVTQGSAGSQPNYENSSIHEWMHGAIGFFDDNGFRPQPGMDDGESVYVYTSVNDPDGSRFITDIMRKRVLDPSTGQYIGIGKDAWLSGKPSNFGLLAIKQISNKLSNNLSFPNSIEAFDFIDSFKERGMNISKFSVKDGSFWKPYVKDYSSNFEIREGRKITTIH